MDVDVDSKPPREHEFSSSLAKATSHQNGPGLQKPGSSRKNFKFSCCFDRMALPSECQDPAQSPAPVISELGPFL
jgi:hypothetical protein